MSYKVGDVLRVREWDDMVDEYGMDGTGAICVPGAFTGQMRYMCGETFTVSQITKKGELLTYISQEEIEEYGEHSWVITAEMLEYADDSQNEEVSIDELLEILSINK